MPRDGSQTPPATSNSVVVRPPRLPSPPSPRGRRGPDRGAQRPFANQKNRRAQNDLERRPSTPPARRRRPEPLQARPTRPVDSMTSLRDLPGRRSCTEEAQVPLAPRRKLGLAPGQLAARGAAPAVSQYETIDSDAIFGVRGASLTSFVASDRPSFRNRRVRPRRCNYSENLKSSSPAISKRLQIFRFASTPPGRYPHCLPEHRPLRHSRMSLIPCQSTPAIDAAIHRPDSTLYQLQLSFHPQSTEPEPPARARRAGEEFY